MFFLNVCLRTFTSRTAGFQSLNPDDLVWKVHLPTVFEIPAREERVSTGGKRRRARAKARKGSETPQQRARACEGQNTTCDNIFFEAAPFETTPYASPDRKSPKRNWCSFERSKSQIGLRKGTGVFSKERNSLGRKRARGAVPLVRVRLRGRSRTRGGYTYIYIYTFTYNVILFVICIYIYIYIYIHTIYIYKYT